MSDYFLTFLNFSPLQWVAQGVGMIALIVSYLIFQQKTRIRVLTFKLTDDVLWGIHYFLLGQPQSGLLNCIGIVRELVFSQRNRKKWASSPVWIPIFIVVCSASTVLTWNGFHCLFSLAGTSLAVVGFFMNDQRKMRYAMLTAQTLWLIYAIRVMSIPAILCNVVQVVSILISVFRFFRSVPTQKEKKHEC